MKKVKLSQEDLPVFEQMVDFLQDYFVKCYKGEKSPSHLPLEFESVFGTNVDFYLKQKMANVALLRMQENFIPLELREMYLTYLEKMKNLAQQLNLKGPLEFAILFMYLLHKGSISLNGKYNFEASNLQNESILGIIPIFNNQGVCRNHAVACSDFINFAFDDDEKITATSSGCELKRESELYKEIIGRKMRELSTYIKVGKSSDLSLLMICKGAIYNLFNGSNHMFTLIKDNSQIFGIDCTNFKILKVLNSKLAKSVQVNCLSMDNIYDYLLYNDLSLELYNCGNSEYFKINSFLSSGSFNILKDEDLKLKFLSAYKKIILSNNVDQCINFFCENTKKIREEMILLANDLKIPSPEDLNLWWSDQSYNHRVGFHPQFLSIDYTKGRQLTKQ